MLCELYLNKALLQRKGKIFAIIRQIQSAQCPTRQLAWTCQRAKVMGRKGVSVG